MNNVSTYAEFPIRKIVVAMMGAAIIAIFLTAFFTGANAPFEHQAGQKKTGQSDEMSELAPLMARIKANPQDADALIGLAEIFSRSKDWQKSEHFWSKVVELDPKNIGAHYHRGFTLIQLERYAEAIAEYEFILQAQPESPQALYYLGAINKYGFQKPDEAKKFFQQALALKPEDRELVMAIENELPETK